MIPYLGMWPFDKYPVKGQSPQYPLPCHLFSPCPLNPQTKEVLKAAVTRPLPSLGASQLYHCPTRQPTQPSSQGGSREGRVNGAEGPGSRGTRAPFLGTPLLERWQALQSHEVPSPWVGLGCYCWPPCVQRCSLYQSPRPCSLRGTVWGLPKLTVWAPGLPVSCTFLPPWADRQDKWEQMACLRLRGLPA